MSSSTAAAAPHGTRNYVIVTLAYWDFTLTDGALRMLVLLHFSRLGYSPFTLAFLFLVYEAAGIGANLIGGWLATRFGIARMLAAGLSTQILGFLLLSAVSPEWGAALSVAWVVVAQGVCGVAKDLTKTASKSAIKLTAGEASGCLFKWVAFFTGSKNAMKGAGFFLGGLLLEAMGFRGALWAMAVALAVVLAGVLLSLPPLMGKAQASKSAKELFGKSRGVNLLAAARVFLFGARDVWFVVGLPVFLYASGWTFTMVGGFLAAWTIGYGVIQASAPALVRRSEDGLSAEVPAARAWSLALAAVPALLAGMMLAGVPRADLFVPVGLCVFGVLFAVNSSVHSYLVLAYAGSEKAAEDVGFYYAANAAGRFAGTLLSGLLYGWGGLGACLIGAAGMLSLCWVLTLMLPAERGAGASRSSASAREFQFPVPTAAPFGFRHGWPSAAGVLERYRNASGYQISAPGRGSPGDLALPFLRGPPRLAVVVRLVFGLLPRGPDVRHAVAGYHGGFECRHAAVAQFRRHPVPDRAGHHVLARPGGFTRGLECLVRSGRAAQAIPSAGHE